MARQYDPSEAWALCPIMELSLSLRTLNLDSFAKNTLRSKSEAWTTWFTGELLCRILPYLSEGGLHCLVFQQVGGAIGHE